MARDRARGGGAGGDAVVRAAVAVVDRVGADREGPGADGRAVEDLAGGHRVGAALEAADRRGRRRAGRPVVDLGVGDRGDRERGRRDVGAARVDRRDRVVGGSRAGEGEAEAGDRLGRAHVGVGEARRRAARIAGDDIGADDAGERAARDRRAGPGVIDLVGGREVDRQAAARDVGRGRRLGQRVVGGVGAADRQAGDRDGLARADGGVAERAGRSGGDQGHAVSADDAHEGSAAGVEGGRRGAVVDLAARGDADHRQGLGGDALAAQEGAGAPGVGRVAAVHRGNRVRATGNRQPVRGERGLAAPVERPGAEARRAVVEGDGAGGGGRADRRREHERRPIG